MHRVVLIGDSIRLHYQPFVAERLTGEAEVVGPPENCETSRKIKANLSRRLEPHIPDVIHLNCGLHDIRVDRDASDVQVPSPSTWRTLKPWSVRHNAVRQL